MMKDKGEERKDVYASRTFLKRGQSREESILWNSSFLIQEQF